MNKIKNLIHKYKTMNYQAKAGIWFVFCSFLQKGISFITIPIFTRILSTEDYGITNLFATWSSLLVLFATLNLSGGVYSRGLLEFNHKKYTSAVQGLATLCSLIVTILVLVFQDYLTQISGLPAPAIYVMCVYFFVIAGINLWTVKQRFIYKYKALIIVTIINSIISTIFGLLAVLLSSSDKGEAKVIWSTVGIIMVALPFYIYNFAKGKTFFDKKMWKYSLSFNLPLLPHYLSNLILHQSDRIMIGWFTGAADVALYSVAYSVSSIVKVLTDAIGQAMMPWRYQNMKKKNYQLINKVSISLLVCVAAVVAVVNLLAPEIIRIFGGEAYMEAIWVVPPIMLSVFFIFIYGMFAHIEFYFLKTKFMMVASIISAALNILLNYIFIQQFGYVACAYTSLFCYMVYTFFHYVYMCIVCKKEIGITSIYNAKSIISIIIATFAVTALSAALYDFAIPRFALIAIVLIVAIIKRKTIKSLIKTGFKK
ncbi:oligosaccharide flippase family protein [Candidatus Saccharibacteria bacterium]|nr:oligosaccharide flippase family protein [Candidatus Saccharibacteria bacterium]